MGVPSRSSNPNTKKAYQDKLEERETWHKLVVKVISWKDNLSNGGVIKKTDKISSKEWNVYYKRTIQTNISYDKDKVVSKLKEIKETIEKNGGFEI